MPGRVTRCSVAPLLCLAVLAGLSAGCSSDSGPDRYPVSGTVTAAGKPLPSGTITFDPDSSAQNEGPAGFTLIENGSFDTSKQGKNTVGGPHILRINGSLGPDPAKAGNELYVEHQEKLDLPQEASQRTIEIPASSVKSRPKSVEP